MIRTESPTTSLNPNDCFVTECATELKSLHTLYSNAPCLNFRSFGHFQAHEYGTAYGFSDDPAKGRIGFAKTRLSVIKVFSHDLSCLTHKWPKVTIVTIHYLRNKIFGHGKNEI